MSVIVVPGRFRRDPHPVGTLAKTLLGVAVAGATEPGRFRRARGYAADNSVTRLEISAGVLVATVTGSEPHPYHVIVSTPSVAPPARPDPFALRPELSRLVPDGEELWATCTCQDDDEFCKHVAAALLVFADELTQRPELLLAWRCADGPEVKRRALRPGSTASLPAGSARPASPNVPSGRVDDEADLAEWERFAGQGSAIEVPPLGPGGSGFKPSALDPTGAEALIAQMLDVLARQL